MHDYRLIFSENVQIQMSEGKVYKSDSVRITVIMARLRVSMLEFKKVLLSDYMSFIEDI